jgi:hypothetical protein
VSRKITREQAREAIANIPNPLEQYKQQSSSLGSGAAGEVPPKALEAGIDAEVWPMLTQDERDFWLSLK